MALEEAVMKVAQRVGRELCDLAPVSASMGAAGVVAASILSQNIFTGIAAAACPTTAFAVYFCVSPVIGHRLLRLSIACTAAVALALLFGVPFETFVITSLLTLSVGAHAAFYIYRNCPRIYPAHNIQ